MSNHPRHRRHGPGWLERGAKLHGRKIRTQAKGSRAARGVKPGGGGIGAPTPRLRRVRRV
jgi:hypothetical protein